MLFSFFFQTFKCFASLCCLVITLPAKTYVKLSAFQKKSVLSRHNGFESELQNCDEHSLKAFSSFFFYFLILLFDNHESSTWSLCMQETPLVESQEKGKENKGKQHTRQNFFHGSKNIQMTAMDSPLFGYAAFFSAKVAPS